MKPKCPKCSALIVLSDADSCWSCGKYLPMPEDTSMKMNDDFKNRKTSVKQQFVQYQAIVKQHYDYIKKGRSQRFTWDHIRLVIEKMENTYLTSNSIRTHYERLQA
jgi:hypothetical protein